MQLNLKVNNHTSSYSLSEGDHIIQVLAIDANNNYLSTNGKKLIVSNESVSVLPNSPPGWFTNQIAQKGWTEVSTLEELNEALAQDKPVKLIDRIDLRYVSAGDGIKYNNPNGTVIINLNGYSYSGGRHPVQIIVDKIGIIQPVPKDPYLIDISVSDFVWDQVYIKVTSKNNFYTDNNITMGATTIKPISFWVEEVE